MEHPKIKEFLAACRKVRGDDVIEFDDLMSETMLPFADSLVITQWVEEEQDLIFRLWGTKLAAMYGFELTGKLIRDAALGDAAPYFRETHLYAIRQKEPVYIGGIVDWNEHADRAWNQVILPMARNGTVTESLSFLYFEGTDKVK